MNHMFDELNYGFLIVSAVYAVLHQKKFPILPFPYVYMVPFVFVAEFWKQRQRTEKILEYD